MRDNNYSFREPYIVDEDGLYVTFAQLQLFLNGPNGEYHKENNTEEFQFYITECKLWNYAYDRSNETDDVIMYWDDTQERVQTQFIGNNATKRLYDNFTESIKFLIDNDEDEPLY